MSGISVINHKNFHTVVNQTFDEALAANGLHQTQLQDKSEMYAYLFLVGQERLPYDSAIAQGSLLERTMAVLPQLTNELESKLTVDKTKLLTSLISACTSIEELLRLKIRSLLKQFVDDSLNLQIRFLQEADSRLESREAVDVAKNEFTKTINQAIQNVLNLNQMLIGGLNNARKTYLGLAKLAIKKLLESSTQVSAEQIKAVVKNNREIMRRLALLASPLLVLFDNINGVKIDSVAPYNYNPDNFELIHDDGAEKLVPKQSTLDAFVKQASNVANTTITRCINDQDQTSTQTLLEFMQENKFKTHGCPAFKGGLMDKFFDQMDAMIGKVVDLHFTVAT